MPDSTAWLAQALCAQVGPWPFYPEPNDTYIEARKVCRKCPVQAECLQTALELETGSEHRHGMWGGLTPRERNTRR